jgi:MFS family permease
MPRHVTCPACRHVLAIPEDVEPGPLSCPRCNGAIEFPGLSAGAADAAKRARRNRRRMLRRGLHGIIGLLSVAIACTYGLGLFSSTSGGPNHWQISVFLWLAGLFAALDFFVVLALSLWIVPHVAASLEDSESATRKRPLGWQILFGIFLVVGIAVAVVVFFFATCVGLLRTLTL